MSYFREWNSYEGHYRIYTMDWFITKVMLAILFNAVCGLNLEMEA